jgi:hypothetical protein
VARQWIPSWHFLAKEQFELFEEGKPQTIKYFSAESDLPLTLGLMIDSSLSMQRMLPEEKIVAGSFLQKVVTAKDLAFVISFDISVDLLQDLTSDMHLLRKGLEKARINTNTAGMTPTGNPGPVPTSRQNQGTLLFDAVFLGADEVLSKQTGRKAMVILTDGDDVGSRLKLRDAIEAAQKADVVTYVLLISDPQYPSNYGDMNKLSEQTGGRIDAFVSASGTGGTIGGVADYLKSRRPAVRCVLADPPGSSLYAYIRTGNLQATGSGSITEGIGIARVTANLKDAPIDDAVHIEDAETVRYVYRLLQEEGLFLGSTSGINVAAAVRVARELGPGHTIVTVLCDGGAKYQSRLFNRAWLEQKGLAAFAPLPPPGVPVPLRESLVA